MVSHIEVERFMGLDWLQDVNKCEHLSPLFPGSPRRKESSLCLFFLAVYNCSGVNSSKELLDSWGRALIHSLSSCTKPSPTSDTSVLSVAVINTIIKSRLGRKRFILFYTLQSVFQKSQGRNLDAVTEAETMEEHRLLTCSSWLFSAWFLI